MRSQEQVQEYHQWSLKTGEGGDEEGMTEDEDGAGVKRCMRMELI